MALKKSQVYEFCQHHFESCRLLVEKYPQDELPSKALSAAQSSLDKLDKVVAGAGLQTDDTNLKEAILQYTQSCLDSTYHEECLLVELEFQEESSDEKVRQIIASLSQPFQLCQLIGSDSTLLGTEMIECIHWRIGALLYMYCHMNITVEERKKKLDKEYFKECCYAGVGHLQLMLSARTPLDKDDDYIAQDSSVPFLLREGIFSDIHMLSLMYAGEMCYWHWELCTLQAAIDPLLTRPGPTQTELDPTQTTADPIQTKLDSTQTVLDHIQSNLDPIQTRLDTIQTNQDFIKTIPEQECFEVHASLRSESQKTQAESCLSVTRTRISDRGLESESDEVETICTSSQTSGSLANMFGYHSTVVIHPLFCAMENSQGIEFVKEWILNFNPHKTGEEVLTKYIEVARGPLKPQGWKYDRAVQLLVSLKKATQSI